MSAIVWEMLFILLLIIANGVLAMSEIAVVSARKARLQQLANAGDARARAALELANAPGHFLSTVQIGMTLVGILAGAYGGATIAETLAAQLRLIPPLAPYSEAIGIGAVVLVISYFTLILGELVPKRIGLNNPERIASAVAVPMQALLKIASPAVRLLSISTEGVLRVLGIQASSQTPVTEGEIQVLIEQGTQSGVFEEVEQDMVEGVFRLGNRRIGSLMTPRAKVVWLDLEDSPEEIQQKIAKSAYSRFPVCRGSPDHVLGVVQVKDLLAHSMAGQPIDLKSSLHPPLFVPESVSALRVLELFRKSGMHIALVIDEHSDLQGVVTVNDILEAIVGDMSLTGAPEAVQREDGSWLVDGLISLNNFKDLVRIGNLPGEERGTFQTLGGFVMMHLGRIPIAGDHFQRAGLRFEVMDMDGRRVDKLLIKDERMHDESQ